MALIRTSGLACGYDGRAVVSGLAFEVGAGELWCILGANGIGKSTLFKTILGLIKPIAGQVLIEEKPVEKWRRRELAKIVSYVPQSHTPPFPFKVGEIVAMGRHPYQGRTGRLSDLDLAVTENAMKQMHVDGLADRPYTAISGGERQLVLLARAVAQQPKVMILDEPVSSLDFGNRARVIGHVRALVRTGVTVILTTHDPDHAFLPESRVLLLENGGGTRCGPGPAIVDEETVRGMYGVDNEIITYDRGRKKTCVAVYDE